MDLPEALRPIQQCYEDYLAGCCRRASDIGALQNLTRLLVGPTTAEGEGIDQLFTHLKDAVAALDGADAALAVQAAEYILLTADGFDQRSRLGIQAAQALALPLISRLSADDCRALLRRYTARYPKRQMLLPRQQDVLAALKRGAQI